jgi:hypothetical protein
MKEKNFLQQTVLHISANKPKTLELLLSHGFDEIVDAGDRDGTTPLMYAAAYGEPDAVIALLRAGADPWLSSDKEHMYLDHALECSHFDLIEDIFKFYTAEEDLAMAQLTLDVALHRYIWRNSRISDPYLDGLRRLLKLGARPRWEWMTSKGNTLFHAISSVDEASLLLEFSSPPTNCQNKAGHTPLMVLSWLLDVELVRKLLRARVPIEERDVTGWTVFEHLFRANSSSCRFCYRQCLAMKWVETFQIAFDLLQAGADFGSPDRCTCYCSSHGCTALQSFLPGINSGRGRTHNLRWVPWIIELFLLLRRLRKSGLQVLIKSLMRRQRFDELGLTHTCCLTSKSSPISRYSSPYNGAMAEEERSEDNHVPPVNADHKELWEEQEELVKPLEAYCETFSSGKDLTPAECESALFSTLARRIVFIERGLTQALSQAKLQHQLTVQRSHQSSNKVSCPKL